jgi:hypothetical protein
MSKLFLGFERARALTSSSALNDEKIEIHKLIMGENYGNFGYGDWFTRILQLTPNPKLEDNTIFGNPRFLERCSKCSNKYAFYGSKYSYIPSNLESLKSGICSKCNVKIENLAQYLCFDTMGEHTAELLMELLIQEKQYCLEFLHYLENNHFTGFPWETNRS